MHLHIRMQRSFRSMNGKSQMKKQLTQGLLGLL
ncbi:hypothetical protein PANT111_170212 [Pantoea brenneri]|uniref:Uncharacterized protein n=1 Tax=Pantoea brenneri TaxID=472694 RepID=A0AAX3J5H9_9GAMM|nr:hypothetical protein PANT111_170212 [Pantoea brenneri]